MQCAPCPRNPGVCTRCVKRGTQHHCEPSVPRKAVREYIMNGGIPVQHRGGYVLNGVPSESVLVLNVETNLSCRVGPISLATCTCRASFPPIIPSQCLRRRFRTKLLLETLYLILCSIGAGIHTERNQMMAG